MPNHVLTEVVFRDVGSLMQIDILGKVSSRERRIDFDVLLPIPLNVWRGSVSTKHEKKLAGTALDWCVANWGTKWNAYGINQGYESVERTDDSLTLRFQTAWSPPMGWFVALLNQFRLPFDYTYFDEGAIGSRIGMFRPDADALLGDRWDETDAAPLDHRRMHKLMWGVEEFETDQP